MTILIVILCAASLAASLASLFIVMQMNSRAASAKQIDAAAVVRDEMSSTRQESAAMAKLLRDEISQSLTAIADNSRKESSLLREEITKMTESQKAAFNTIAETNRSEANILRDKIDAKFKEIQTSNETKLEEMRKTVDEKLHSTLEKRLGESFKIVSERLEAVYKGLGEMQNLAAGVGDLKKVLTNVKTRGTWGEIQLGAILEQILTPQQYAANVQLKENSREIVEYAVKLPGKNNDQCVYLAIDSKFPKEDYERLVDASAAGNPDETKTALKGLITGIERCAQDISGKYIDPPATTDFAIMFLPTEGLYAEVLREPGLHDKIQRKYRVLIAGPTTLSALLSSLRMGFHTLAIEKRSSEVWQVLGAVKTEFGKFGDMLDKAKKQLATAANTLDETATRTRAMERKLKPVEALPQDEAEKLLQFNIKSDLEQ